MKSFTYELNEVWNVAADMDENQSTEERVVLFKSMNKRWPKQGAKFSYDKTWKTIHLKNVGNIF